MNSKKIIVLTIALLILNGCANTGKMNFENIWNNRIAINKPTIERIVRAEKETNDYVGKETITRKTKKIIRHHFKIKGHPKWEPCYYYADVDYASKRLLAWGYDDKGDKRACVN